ncbi:hypothetical protein V6N13_147198 [Hibiscus sabdariffa]
MRTEKKLTQQRSEVEENKANISKFFSCMSSLYSQKHGDMWSNVERRFLEIPCQEMEINDVRQAEERKRCRKINSSVLPLVRHEHPTSLPEQNHPSPDLSRPLLTRGRATFSQNGSSLDHDRPRSAVPIEPAIRHAGPKEQCSLTEETLYDHDVLHRSISMIIFSFFENRPRLRKASRNTGRNVQLWTRRGSPLRALLVISVTTASATIDRLSSHLFGSCGRLLVLFLCLCNSHLSWALSLAAIVISAATISAIFAAMVAADHLYDFLLQMSLWCWNASKDGKCYEVKLKMYWNWKAKVIRTRDGEVSSDFLLF